MSQISLQPSPLKDGRRVLGEKSANACLSPTRSPVKGPFVSCPTPKKLLPSPSFVAQKRPIGQVDGEDAAGGIRRVQRVEARVEEAAASSQVVRSSAEREIQPESTSDAMNLDEEPEQSQQRHRPLLQDGAHGHEQAAQNYPESISRLQTVPSDPKTRKQFIQEKATLLRDKLQNAMRHVRDPQFDRRVSELEAHSRKYPRLSGPEMLGSRIQRHLEQKYGTEKDDEEEGEDAEDYQMLSTPRAHISQQLSSQEEKRAEEEEVTPKQDTSEQQRGKSPTEMLLSSPTYSSNPTTTAQGGRFDDDPQRQTVMATPHSQPRDGDGDAVDGLLRLMGTSANGSVGAVTYEGREF
ncbi:uncharacterized protein BJX67DRAFT_50822 [Aspergillus lucknowensis]|uniref:Uncharacterized protein n=1 Tax=Aspergillus lucknowensis TaxID=176173 RepID=A0ABR4LUQ6_9EURO